VDWESPDFASATRLDLDDIELVDLLSNSNTSGANIAVDSRQMNEGQTFRVYFDGPASTSVDIVSYRLTEAGDLPETGDVLGILDTDATGSGTVDVTVPVAAGAASNHVALMAEYGGDEVGIMLVLKPEVQGGGNWLGALTERDEEGHEFHVDLDSIRQPLGSGAANVGFSFHGFDAGWNVRIFATAKENGAYDDNDAVQLTAQAEPIGPEGLLFLEIPCVYQDAQAYRLTGCAWPPGVPPNGGHMGEAIRFDVEDVVPYFDSATAPVEELDEESYLRADDNWLLPG
jgi:hypothetical protein